MLEKTNFRADPDARRWMLGAALLVCPEVVATAESSLRNVGCIGAVRPSQKNFLKRWSQKEKLLGMVPVGMEKLFIALIKFETINKCYLSMQLIQVFQKSRSSSNQIVSTLYIYRKTKVPLNVVGYYTMINLIEYYQRRNIGL